MNKAYFIIFTSILLSIIFSVSFLVYNPLLIPSDLNITTIKKFSARLSNSYSLNDSVTRLSFLLFVHLLQIYVCMPMLHITKLMYGYWFGLTYGLLICCTWELVLIYIFLSFSEVQIDPNIKKYIDQARDDRTLNRQIFCMCLSSIPLQATAVTVSLGGVDKMLYMKINFVITFIWSAKNVTCGHYMQETESAKVFFWLSCLVFFSTLLPTITTLYIAQNTLSYMLIKASHKHESDSLFEPDFEEDLLDDELLGGELLDDDLLEDKIYDESFQIQEVSEPTSKI